jgi:DNA primase
MATTYKSPSTERVLETAHQYLKKIRMAGPDNIIALCPFHDDSSPSFAMNIHNGLYICYACGEKGAFRTFLTKIGLTTEQIRVNYGRTLEELKKNAPPPPDPLQPGIIVDSNKHIPEDLLGIFHRCPEDLLAEGFTEEVLQDFGVGVDIAHHRITFPLRDLQGNLVGISGRAMLAEQEERYKVYRNEYRTWDLPPYDTEKSVLLWNAHRVHPVVMRSLQPAPVVLVEGFKACMWLTQAGVPRVVALMTKTMSWAQKLILQDMGGPYILMLDNDEAGVEGTVYVSKELHKACNDVRVGEYEENQPTDVPLEDVLQLIDSATDYNEMTLSSQ